MFLIIAKGGWTMIFLLLCSFVGLYIVIQKYLFLKYNKVDNDLLLEKIKNRLVTIGTTQTIQDLKNEKNIMSKVVSSVVKLSELPREEVQEGIKAATLTEIPKLEKNMAMLSAIITVAPMLGLLGTVLGLMKIFNVMGRGALGNAEALSAGIAEALITTVTGLVIAIPFMFFYQHLSQKIEHYILEMERVMHALLNFFRYSGGVKP